MILETIAIILAGVHFSIPLLYYVYLKHAHLNKHWNIRIDESYKPKVTIIVPTYNEAKFIRDKLDNLYSQDYQKSLMEIIVVDSKSNDGTVDLVKEWAYKHTDVDLKLLEEPERRGMVPALNYALKNCKINGEIIVFTDVDAFWDADALAKITKYFADPNVGAVTASIIPTTLADNFLEGAYRNYYNQLRIAESKIHSTPVHNGALAAFRAHLIYKMGGLPSYTGNNDSTPASLIAFMGYRAIQVEDVVVNEPVRQGQFRRKIRRAQHLLLSFLKTKQYAKRMGFYDPNSAKTFERIWKMEWWLHVINPWLLIICVLILTTGAFYASPVTLIFLGIGLLFLVLRPYRTWILQQFYLVAATIRNLWTREIMWSK
jgi:cellulose synthase/poly-beta-1,6-N-acetylglucosamine synthase-like glycosyltransferase